MMRLNLLKGFSIIGAFAIFFPIFQNTFGTSGAILVNAAVIAASCVVLFAAFGKGVSKERFVGKSKESVIILFVFLILLIHIPLAMSSGALFNNFSIAIRDFYEIHRPIMYTLVFCLAYFAFQNIDDLNKLHKFLIYIFIGLVILGLNQSFRVFDEITVLYTKEHNAMTRRLSAPFVNPYDYAFVMILFIVYFFFWFICGRWYNILFFVFALILFISTQSRSMTIGLGFAMLFWMPIVIGFANRRSLAKYRLNQTIVRYVVVSFAGIITFSLLIGYLLDNYGYLTKAFVQIIEQGDLSTLDGATSTRQDQLLYAFDLARKNPVVLLFGNGAAKNHMEFVESTYTYYIFRYGLIGLLLYFLVPWVLAIGCSIRCLKRINYKHSLFPFYAAILIWLLCLPVCSIGNNLTEQVRVSFLYYSTLGIVVRSVVILRPSNSNKKP